MDVKPIRNHEDYRETLQEIELILAAEPGSREGEQLDVLVTLVEAYERMHFSLGANLEAKVSRFCGASPQRTASLPVFQRLSGNDSVSPGLPASPRK